MVSSYSLGPLWDFCQFVIGSFQPKRRGQWTHSAFLVRTEHLAPTGSPRLTQLKKRLQHANLCRATQHARRVTTTTRLRRRNWSWRPYLFFHWLFFFFPVGGKGTIKWQIRISATTGKDLFHHVPTTAKPQWRILLVLDVQPPEKLNRWWTLNTGTHWAPKNFSNSGKE